MKYMEGGEPLPMEPQYEMDYMIFLLAEKDVSKYKHIEENYNIEDFILRNALNAYNEKTIESNKPK